MAAYIQFTSRLKSTTQDGILAEAQQIAVSSSDNTSIKSYIDSKVASAAGAAYRPKGSVTFAALSALTSANVGDVYNITDAFTLSGKSYAAGSNVACLKAFSSKVTPDETYWDVLGGFIDLSPYAKSTELNTAKSDLQGKIDATNANVSTLARKLDERVDSNVVLKDMNDYYQISGADDSHPAKIGKDTEFGANITMLYEDEPAFKNIAIRDKDGNVQMYLNAHATLGDSYEAMDDIAIGKHVYITEDTTQETLFGTREDQYGTGVTINPNGIKVYHADLRIGKNVYIGPSAYIIDDFRADLNGSEDYMTLNLQKGKHNLIVKGCSAIVSNVLIGTGTYYTQSFGTAWNPVVLIDNDVHISPTSTETFGNSGFFVNKFGIRSLGTDTANTIIGRNVRIADGASLNNKIDAEDVVYFGQEVILIGTDANIGTEEEEQYSFAKIVFGNDSFHAYSNFGTDINKNTLDVRFGDKVNIAPNVSIGRNTSIGSGVTIPNDLNLQQICLSTQGYFGFGKDCEYVYLGSGIEINKGIGTNATGTRDNSGVLITSGMALTSSSGGELWFGTDPTRSEGRMKVAFAKDVESAKSDVTELTKRVAALESLLTVAS